MTNEPVYGDARLIEAVRHLRWLARQGPCEIQESIDLLDEAGIFDPIDKTTGVRLDPKDTCASCPRADNIHASCPCEEPPVVATFPIGPDGETGQFHADGSYSELNPTEQT